MISVGFGGSSVEGVPFGAGVGLVIYAVGKLLAVYIGVAVGRSGIRLGGGIIAPKGNYAVILGNAACFDIFTVKIAVLQRALGVFIGKVVKKSYFGNTRPVAFVIKPYVLIIHFNSLHCARCGEIPKVSEVTVIIIRRGQNACAYFHFVAHIVLTGVVYRVFDTVGLRVGVEHIVGL